MMNAGKVFEKNFMDSMPPEVWCYRFRDSAGAWQGGENTRFTPSNICDFLVFNEDSLLLLELKSHKGKSLPLHCIREKNLAKMIDANRFKKIHSFLVVNFRDVDETYAVYASLVSLYMETNPEKKSIPIAFFRNNGFMIPQELKKVHYRYDVRSLLSEH